MKHPRYSEYRASGVDWLGEVPAHWHVRRLRFLASTNPLGSRMTGVAENSMVSFVPMDAVGEYGGLRLDTERELAEISAGYTYFADGDVVLAKITPCFENGKGALASGLTNGVAFGTTELHVLRPDTALDRRYLFYLTIAHSFRKLGESEMFGAGGQKRVPESFIKDFRTPLPPPDEQRTIAAFLDRETARIDALIATKRRFIALLQEKRAALISHAVTRGLDPDAPLKDSGIAWLTSVPASWQVRRLRFLFDMTGGMTPDKAEPSYWDGDIPWVTPKDMKVDVLSDSEDHITPDAIGGTGLSMVPANAVLLVVRGMILIHSIPVALTTAPVTINQDMKALIATKEIHPVYLAWMLRGIRDLLLTLVEESGHGTKALRTDVFRSIKVPLPSRSEQVRIVEKLACEVQRMDALRAAAQRAIKLLGERRASLIAGAVTGRLDTRTAA